MHILITNDDGYTAKGIKVLVETMRTVGKVSVIAPKYHQSGMSMAVTMGLKPIAVKDVSTSEDELWLYVDGTPASCVKYAIDNAFLDNLPDVVVSGINHGSNAGSATLYSGTLGAAQEAVLGGMPAIGVSIDDMSQDPDFTYVRELFPEIFKTILSIIENDKFGIYYNVNFPKGKPKGIRIGHQGIQHWIKEFEPFDDGLYERRGTTPQKMGITALPVVEEGETVYWMKGDLIDDDRNTEGADHHLLSDGYITITPLRIDNTDYTELERLVSLNINKDFK